jgi:alkanesulfonate monooxygenase SsuD/methylene tetrahydromethanopterin reductase-like flavin-dependent oxidoreductase (luciferase family)
VLDERVLLGPVDDGMFCNPHPISSPRPPVLIGGSGERKTLRLVAKYADACNLFASDPDEIAHKLDVLQGHCDTEGRDYDTITRTMLSRGDPGDVDALVDELAGYAKLGNRQGSLRAPRRCRRVHAPPRRRCGSASGRPVATVTP